MIASAWNPATWGGEGGGVFLVVLVVLVVGACVVGAWYERRL